MDSVNLADAKAHLSELIERAPAGVPVTDQTPRQAYGPDHGG